MAKIINKTDHVIALMIDGKWETIMPYGLSCKLKGTKSEPIVKDGIQFNPVRYDSVIELPNRQIGTIIIVEREVALFIWKTKYQAKGVAIGLVKKSSPRKKWSIASKPQWMQEPMTIS